MIKSNIRAENRRDATFSWLDGWTYGQGGAALQRQRAKLADVPDEEETIDVAVLLRRSRTSLATRATAGRVTDATMATLRAECSGWDCQALHAEFHS